MKYPVIASKLELPAFHSSRRTGAMTVAPTSGRVSMTETSRSGSKYGSGRTRIESIAENTALFAPMPSASVRTTVIVNAGVRAKLRSA